MSSLPRSRTLRLPLCLLLLAVGPLAMAQNARVAANPGADGAERSSTEASAEDEARSEGNTQRRARASTTGSRGDEAASPRVPRWHSYLPGMFR